MTDEGLIRIAREAGLETDFLCAAPGRELILKAMRAAVEAERTVLLDSLRDHCSPPEASGTDAGIGYDLALCNVQEFIRARGKSEDERDERR